MADPLRFADPFRDEPSVGSAPKKSIGKVSYLSAPISSMPIGIAMLRIMGQGTIAVKSKATKSIEIKVSAENSDPMLILRINQNEVVFCKKSGDKEETLTSEVVENHGSRFIQEVASGDGTVYWLSIDRSNWVLRYGKYYTWSALTLLEVKLNPEVKGAVKKDGEKKDAEKKDAEKKDAEKKNAELKIAELEKWLGKLKIVEVEEDGEKAPNVRISPLPVTIKLPPIVVGNEAVSLRALDLSGVTTWANLPKACQNLYHNIAGQKIALEAEFKEFAETIHNSVVTPGLFAYNVLEKKKNKEHGKKGERSQSQIQEDERHTYLRITIGSAKGNSPGIPYVMEVWPPGHKSPIHDHGDACAVIRVLSGSIQCTWYDDLTSKRTPNRLFEPVQLEKDMITWLGDNQYQIHALENITDKTCVTLQCYEFPEDNNLHEEKFRFIKGDHGEKEEFTPNSDCTFTDFHKKMVEEWLKKQAV